VTRVQGVAFFLHLLHYSNTTSYLPLELSKFLNFKLHFKLTPIICLCIKISILIQQSNLRCHHSVGLPGAIILPDPGREITQRHRFKSHDGGTSAVKSSTMLVLPRKIHFQSMIHTHIKAWFYAIKATVALLLTTWLYLIVPSIEKESLKTQVSVLLKHIASASEFTFYL